MVAVGAAADRRQPDASGRRLVPFGFLSVTLALAVWSLRPQAESLAPLAATAVAGVEAAATAAVLEAYFGDVATPERSVPVVAGEGVGVADEAAGPLSESELSSLVQDLRDDGIPGNGQCASRRLAHLTKGPVPALEAALRSWDLQQRHLAADVLRNRYQRDGGLPSTDLLGVCVEALAHDVRVQLRRTHLDNVTATSTRFLVPHTEAARDALRRGLGAGDAQQRFLCSFLLAQAGITDDVGIVARELVVHLGDNDIEGDALMAVHGLYRLGDAALPTVRLWRPHVDEQARSLLDLVELDLQQPPVDHSDLRARRRLHQVTDLYHDPAIEFDLHRSVVATWSGH